MNIILSSSKRNLQLTESLSVLLQVAEAALQRDPSATGDCKQPGQQGCLLSQSTAALPPCSRGLEGWHAAWLGSL